MNVIILQIAHGSIKNMIYKSQEPLRILGDLSDDVEIVIRRVKENSVVDTILKGGHFEELPRLEKPLKLNDGCYLYANSQFYIIDCKAREGIL